MIEEKDVLIKANNGDQVAVSDILNDNKSIVSAIARKYYLLGGDTEDLIQEGMIGLYKAINSFDAEKYDNFRFYASRIIEREIITAIRKENSQKNKILDESISIDNYEIMHEDNYPELDVLDEENYNEFINTLQDKLSKVEFEVVKLYLKGYSYRDIANDMNMDIKAIGNALSRIRKKLKYLKESL